MDTTNQHLWGWATFGKRDGFELLSIDGAIKEFEIQKQIERLSQALQLRLEDVRIFPESEILGTARLTQVNDHWQFYMLYRYTLDIYKRDGFYAGAIGLKDAKADPRELLMFLRRLTDQAKQRIRKETITVNLPALKIESAIISNGIERRKQGFIPFATTDLSEQLAFIEKTMKGELPEYHRLLGSNDIEVMKTVDEYKYARFHQNPFYHVPLKINPFKPNPIPIKEEPHEDHPPIVKESVIHAFEQAEYDPWKKGKNGSNSKTSSTKEKDSFLGGLFKILGIK